ncbi:MAG: hypothetical protein K8R67_12630 [Desulfobacteraceae bacterium]|nr:hypothetical protein [Desulfobacteraceae bacterium]
MKENKQKKPKLIVMPFVPENDQVYNGTGLGIHFFFGNIVAVHTDLEEFWFGWRVKKLFSEKKLLKAYCSGGGPALDIPNLARKHEIQYWLQGRYKQNKNMIALSLSLFDAKEETQIYETQLIININDGLITCSSTFFDWLSQCNLHLSKDHKKKVLWPEKISIKGLEFLGYALETTYLSYIAPSPTNDLPDIEKFEKAVAISPESYLTHDLLAWALYKRQNYNAAIQSFKSALSFNKYGLGALAGLMWCAIFTNNEEKAYKYAIAKADVRKESHGKAKAFVANKLNLNL